MRAMLSGVFAGFLMHAPGDGAVNADPSPCRRGSIFERGPISGPLNHAEPFVIQTPGAPCTRMLTFTHICV